MSGDEIWLPLLLAVPLVGAVGVGLVPRSKPQVAKVAGLAVSLVVLLFVVGLGLAFTAGDGDGITFDFPFVRDWIPQLGVTFGLGLDGAGLALVALTAVLVPVCLLASWGDADRGTRPPRAFFSLVLVLEALLIGVFAATDVFLFYVFFEAMLIPMYFLIGGWGGPRRAKAAVKFLLYSLVGGLLMLAAVIGLYVVSIDSLGTGTFAYSELLGVQMTEGVQIALFSGFFIAFAIKAPLFPFHTWLPDAGQQAPTGAAVLLVGVLDKVGTFGFLRYCLPLFPEASETLTPLVWTLAIIGIFYGGLLAIGQRDLRRFVAYTSIAHFGFITLGVFAVTTQGLSGATLYMVNHGLSTGALFLVVGILVARRGTADIDAFGGVWRVAPLVAGAGLLAGLSSLALPGTNSFVSEFLVLVGTFTRSPVAAVIAGLGIVVAALYILLWFQRVFTGRVGEGVAGMRDLTTREAWALAPVLALVLVLGVYPKPLLDVTTPAAVGVQAEAGRSDPTPTGGDFSPDTEQTVTGTATGASPGPEQGD